MGVTRDYVYSLVRVGKLRARKVWHMENPGDRENEERIGSLVSDQEKLSNVVETRPCEVYHTIAEAARGCALFAEFGCDVAQPGGWHGLRLAAGH